MNISRILFSTALVAASAVAQGQIVRGEVEDVRNTFNQFYFKCTNIPVTSTAVSLAAIQDTQGEFTVQNVGTATSPAFEVLSFTPALKQFDMGNIRLGRTDTWEITGAPGELFFFFVGATNNTGYTPFGAAGTWLLGMDAATLVTGVIPPLGRFQTQIGPPNNQQLVGLEFTGQALIGGPAGWKLTNPDCKTVRAN